MEWEDLSPVEDWCARHRTWYTGSSCPYCDLPPRFFRVLSLDPTDSFYHDRSVFIGKVISSNDMEQWQEFPCDHYWHGSFFVQLDGGCLMLLHAGAFELEEINQTDLFIPLVDEEA